MRSEVKGVGAFTPVRVYNGGSALAVDDDPNTTSPSAARRIVVSANIPLATNLLVCGIGGTSVTIRPWVYDSVNGKWVTMVAAIALTSTGTGIAAGGTSIGLGASEKSIFVQITAVSGATELYYGIL